MNIVFPVIYVVATLFILIVPLIVTLGLGIIATGIPVYFVFVYTNKEITMSALNMFDMKIGSSAVAAIPICLVRNYHLSLKSPSLFVGVVTPAFQIIVSINNLFSHLDASGSDRYDAAAAAGCCCCCCCCCWLLLLLLLVLLLFV